MRINVIRRILAAFFFVCCGMVWASEVSSSHIKSPYIESVDQVVPSEQELIDDSLDLVEELAIGLDIAESAESVQPVSALSDLRSKTETESDIEKTEYNELPSAIDSFQEIRRQFLLEQIESIDTLPDEEGKNDLGDLVRQLDRLQIPVKGPLVEPQEQDIQPEPVEVVIEVHSEQPVVPKKSEAVFSEKDLISTIENVQTVVDPLPLADMLFRQGYYQQAFQYYQQFSDQLDEEAVIGRQWVLFQMANCCRQTDPQKAIQFYSDLINSFPNSKWAAIALSRQKTIQWDQENQIQDIITEKRDADKE